MPRKGFKQSDTHIAARAKKLRGQKDSEETRELKSERAKEAWNRRRAQALLDRAPTTTLDEERHVLMKLIARLEARQPTSFADAWPGLTAEDQAILDRARAALAALD